MRSYSLIAILVLFSITLRAQTLQQVLDATDLTWTTSGTGGSSGWNGETGVSYDGVSAAVASAHSFPNTQTATLQTTVTGPGTLTFWWYLPAPPFAGQLSFQVGGITQTTLSVYAHWTLQTVYIGAGSQTLTWVNSAPPGGNGVYDAFVDQVTWTTGATGPLILTQPFSQSVAPGLNATFFVKTGGTPPLSYQWQLNGTNLPGATNTSLTITNAQSGNLGDYQVAISNDVSTVTSSSATLEFGNIAAWGENSAVNNVGTAPPGATNVAQISGGEAQNLLLKTDGTIMGWGLTNFAQVNGSNVLHCSALELADVILNGDGTVSAVSAWGNSAITDIPANLTNVIAIAQGPAALYCLALKADGTVVVWGSNNAVTNIPSTVSNIVSVAAGEEHCLALRSDGILIGWGDNSFGQLQFPSNLYSTYPTNKVVAIAAGNFHSLALKADGTVVAWGYNFWGMTNVPSSANGAVAIAAGYFHSLALLTNGTVVAWGQNAYGQTNVPSNLSNVVAIAAGGYHNLALVGSGSPASASAGHSTYSSNVFSLSIPSRCGRIFELDYETSLAGTNWTALPYVAGNGTNLILTDPTATDAQRFYRVRRW